MAIYASQLDNVRSALEWAGSDEGDPAIVVSLTARTVSLWVQLSLTGECRGRVERALLLVEPDGLDAHTKYSQMQLNAALGWALMYAAGRSEEIGAAWAETLRLAEELDDTSYQLRALWGIWVSRINAGDWAAGLALSERLLDALKDSDDHLDRRTTGFCPDT